MPSGGGSISQNTSMKPDNSEQKENGMMELPQTDFNWQGDQKMGAHPAVTNGIVFFEVQKTRAGIVPQGWSKFKEI